MAIRITVQLQPTIVLGMKVSIIFLFVSNPESPESEDPDPHQVVWELQIFLKIYLTKNVLVMLIPGVQKTPTPPLPHPTV